MIRNEPCVSLLKGFKRISWYSFFRFIIFTYLYPLNVYCTREEGTRSIRHIDTLLRMFRTTCNLVSIIYTRHSFYDVLRHLHSVPYEFLKRPGDGIDVFRQVMGTDRGKSQHVLCGFCFRR